MAIIGRKAEYELSLTSNYAFDWDISAAVRELIQNGLDQESLSTGNSFSLKYDKANLTLRFINPGASLDVNTLLLGNSTKTGNKNTIGQFGEGYKIAALVLNRLGKTFTVRNNEENEIWIGRLKKSRKWKDNVLTFFVERNQTTDKDLVIEIGNISPEEYNEIQNIWLRLYQEFHDDLDDFLQTDYGQILTDKSLKGKIFVNGLYVTTHEELYYGYDFKPEYIKLERDRKTCDSWDVSHYASLSLMCAVREGKMLRETLIELINQNVADATHVQYSYYIERDVYSEIKNDFIKKYPKTSCIPVIGQDDADEIRNLGGTPIIVSNSMAGIVSSIKKERIQSVQEKRLSIPASPAERLKMWLDFYKNDIPANAVKELEKIIAEI